MLHPFATVSILTIIGLTNLPVSATSTITTAEPSGGTLNLILANRNGFVVAADSRRTAPNGQHWDDSQKLFRVGKRAGLVIAGFASATAPGTPLDVQVSALLRDHFDNQLQRQNVSFDGQDFSGWMRGSMAEELQVVGAVFGSFGNYDMNMVAIAAGYDNKKKARIVRFEFKPKFETFGPALTLLPVFDTEVKSVEVKGFTWATAGIDTVAKAVIAGAYDSSDDRIRRFYAARERNRLDTIPLGQLREIAEAILDETKNSTGLVGGPNQIAIVPRRGKVDWLAPEMQSSKQKVLRTILWLGGPTNIRRQDGQHFTMRMSVFEDLTSPATNEYTQVFVGGGLYDVDVALDGNIFAGFMFSNVTFKYRGGHFWFGGNNQVQECQVQVEEGSVLPLGSPLAQRCSVMSAAKVQTSASTVGTPLRPEHVGCVIPTKNGSVKTKTTGKYKGQDCRGSHIQVPIGMPIPGYRNSTTQ